MARYLTCNLPGAVIYSNSGDLPVASNLTDVRSATGTPGHLPQVCDATITTIVGDK